MIEICSNDSVFTLPYPSYYVYTINTGLAIILNAFMLLVILLTRKFRQQKEYVMLAANFMHEILAALASFLAGWWRLSVFWNNHSIPLLTRGICFTAPHIFLFIIVFPGSGLIAMASALDRLLTIVIPLRYSKFSQQYAILMMGGVYSLVFPMLIIAGIIIYSSQDYSNYLVDATCDFSAITYPYVNVMTRIARSASTLIGVILYIPIAVKLRQVHRASGDYSKLNTKQRKNMLRFNIIVSFLVLNELALLVTPDIILMLWPAISISSWLYYLTVLKGFFNSCIVVVIQKEIRTRIYNIIRGKLKCKNSIIHWASHAS